MMTNKSVSDNPVPAYFSSPALPPLKIMPGALPNEFGNVAPMTDATKSHSDESKAADELSPVVRRILELIDKSGLSGRDISKKIGKSPTYLTTLTGGKTKVPGTKALIALSNFFNEDLFRLVPNGDRVDDPDFDPQSPLVVRNENGQPAFVSRGGTTSRHDDGALSVVGIVEAGAWRERDEFGDITDEVVPLVRDPRFPNARQEAHLVRGDSMDQAGLLDGGYIRMIAYDDVPLSLRPGTIVVLERASSDHSTFERTVKQVEFVNGEYHFRPRSSNPRHKPIVLPQDVDLFDETSEVRVLGFVTAFINPIPY
ncbi:S24 family peptidase [Methylobacterium aquaticum]|uniref:S24 family peptidase n=1 Tax=Methylobacterium aquaticum TaxID=270351 RepID=UPI0012E0E034|nr:S24 family peptidase [Methylobacterium aquaticum]